MLLVYPPRDSLILKKQHQHDEHFEAIHERFNKQDKKLDDLIGLLIPIQKANQEMIDKILALISHLGSGANSSLTWSTPD